MGYPSSQVGEEVPTSQVSIEKKRKNSNGTSLSSGQSKDARESKIRKQRKPSGGLKATEEKKHKADELKATKACEEPPSGYIHVRARRGQATDSHNLAERVRRKKISAGMKMMQGLVPGCDKVINKVGDLVGVKYFPIEPEKHLTNGHQKKLQ